MENILPLILAILLIFLIPMLMRRYWLEWSDLIRFLFSRPGKRDYAEAARNSRGKREPWQSNGRSQDLQALVSTLLILVRRNKLGLVYPATIEYGGQMANLVALVVTRQEVIGINCFGFGGTITEGDSHWNQHMNGVDQTIPDPIEGNRRQAQIVRRAMHARGLEKLPMWVVAVFTSHTVTIETSHRDEVFDTRGLLTHLKGCAARSGTLDPEDVSRQLNECVTRMKPKR